MQNKEFFLYILLVDIYVAKTTFGLLPLEVLSKCLACAKSVTLERQCKDNIPV